MPPGPNIEPPLDILTALYSSLEPICKALRYGTRYTGITALPATYIGYALCHRCRETGLNSVEAGGRWDPHVLLAPQLWRYRKIVARYFVNLAPGFTAVENCSLIVGDTVTEWIDDGTASGIDAYQTKWPLI